MEPQAPQASQVPSGIDWTLAPSTLQFYLQQSNEISKHIEAALHSVRNQVKFRRSRETAAEREARLQTIRDRKRFLRAQETPEQREARLREVRERKRFLRAQETPEQREARLREVRDQVRCRRARELPEQRAARLQSNRERMRFIRSQETPEQRAARQQINRERRRQYLQSKEMPEQRAARLWANRERKRVSRAQDVPEQRTARLEIQIKRRQNGRANNRNTQRQDNQQLEIQNELQIIPPGLCDQKCDNNVPPWSFYIPDMLHKITENDDIIKGNIDGKQVAGEISLPEAYAMKPKESHCASKIEKVGQRFEGNVPLSNDIICRYGLLPPINDADNQAKSKMAQSCSDQLKNNYSMVKSCYASKRDSYGQNWENNVPSTSGNQS